jgi:hypothetical protein
MLVNKNFPGIRDIVKDVRHSPTKSIPSSRLAKSLENGILLLYITRVESNLGTKESAWIDYGRPGVRSSSCARKSLAVSFVGRQERSRTGET